MNSVEQVYKMRPLTVSNSSKLQRITPLAGRTASKDQPATMQSSILLLSALVSFSIASPALQRRQDEGDEFEEPDGLCATSDDCAGATYCETDDDGSNGGMCYLSCGAHCVIRLG